MPYNNYDKKKNGSPIVMLTCAGLFCAFTFAYLYFYQADLLAVSQHLLSGGITTYNKLIGAIIITVTLLILQLLVHSATRLAISMHALTYFPSVLVLSTLSSMIPRDNGTIEIGLSLWFAALLLLIWLAVIYFIKQSKPWQRNVGAGSIFFTNAMWKNVLVIALQFIFVGFAGNNDATMHYRMHIESCLRAGDLSGATNAGKKSKHSDSNLTMLRVYSLARTNSLADKLFHYSIKGNSNDIVPMQGGNECLMYSNDSIYKFLGGRPLNRMDCITYLEILQNRGFATDKVKDYLLCAYLIDRRIDDFVKALPQYYDINDSLPIHYREALTLYTHLRATPYIVYHNNVMDTDYEDMQNLEKQFGSHEERKLAVYRQYSNTYWWYYEYGEQ